MKYEWLDEYLMKKKGVTRDLQKDWNWMRYQIGGKMFAAVCRNWEDNRPYYITLKLDPLEGDFLRKQYEDIIPGYYMNKTHWNSVKADGEVPDELLKDLLDKSYQLVLGGLSKKKQREILEAANLDKKKQREILETTKKDDLISCCGADCASCNCYGEMCKGCSAVCGRVFHAPEGKECPIYACCRIQNGFSSCGECGKLPCDLILGTRDPSFSDEEFRKNVAERVKRLKG